MLIFSGSSNKPLAEKVAVKMGHKLQETEIFVFPDGERRIKVLESVLGHDTVIIQPTAPPVDTNYMELCLIIDALKRTGARHVTVVIPYLGYQRQDHVFRDGEARSLEVVIRIIETAGADRIIGFDFHTIKTPEIFHIPVAHLSALPLFAEHIKSQGFNKEDTVLVTPDMGGIRRIKLLSELLDDMAYISIVKDRDLVSGNIESNSFDGTIKKRVVIVDDMASSGNTLVKAADLMLNNGAEEAYSFVTHAVFSPEAPSLLQNSSLKEIYVTDTILVTDDKKFEKLNILSVAPLIAQQLKEWS